MLSASTIRKREIFAACEKSGPICPGEAFRGLELAEEDVFAPAPGQTFICCGTVGEDEILFRSEDCRAFFTIRGGWGRNGEALCGLRIGFSYSFAEPLTPEELRGEAHRPLGPDSSWAGAMAHHAGRYAFALIRKAMENNP